MKNFKATKRRLLSLVLLMALLLTSCGTNPKSETMEESSSKSNEINAAEGTDIYYSIDEISLPNPDKSIQDLLGGEKFAACDPVFSGDYIYRAVNVFNKEGNIYESYLQVLKLSDMEWKNISGSEIYEIGGKKYHIGGEPFVSENGEVYCYAYESEQPENDYLCKMVEGSIDKIACLIPKEVMDNRNQSGGELLCDASGNFYMCFNFTGENKNIIFLDGLLQIRKTVKEPGEVRGIVQKDTSSDTYWYGIDEDRLAIIGNVANDEILLKGFAGVASGGFLLEYSSSGKLLAADNRTIWEISEEPELIYDFLQNDYLINTLYGMERSENGEIQFLVKLDGEYTVLKLKESNTPKATEKQEIVMAFAMEQRALNRWVTKFNRQSDKYHISVMLPEEDEDWATFRDKIQLEMSVGKGPDILGHDVILNINPYVENDYLECLDGLLEDETQYLQAALEGCKIDGKLYGIPYDCSLNFAAYSEEFTKGVTSWTLPEMMKAVKASKAKFLQKGCRSTDIVLKWALYDNSNTTYIDWNKGESHLTEKPFLELLEFAKKYGFGYTGKFEEEEGDYIQTGEACMVEVPMDQLYWMNALEACFEGKETVIGYPRAEGNGIYVSSRELYISANSSCKEGAKEFLKYLLSEEVQSKYIEYDQIKEMQESGITMLLGHRADLPVHKKAFVALMDKAANIEKGYRTIFGITYDETPYTEEQIEKFYFLLENAQPNNYKVASLSSMISEELEPYFAGDKSAEDVAKILDNRVQLYLNERKK
ncbi:ABC transporter substrate-binding protein [Anaerosporobacter sp.]|uniref:ABC transporter substrate-binding protein n=1 Tax=Anaerosporobacter sp. TaxID=1872529 RepID=UPI00286F9CC1|nr:extracellular solute-binding protein [Anaerosporobacter sp.]